MTVPSDNPIQSGDADMLGRRSVAVDFVESVRAIDASQGLVVGVLGPWGSGKTSFVNLAREHLQKQGLAVLDFNPWMFSGAEQLVESFFIEVSAQLKVRHGRLASVGKDMGEYGEAFSGLGWLPVVGTWIERARGVNKALVKLLERRQEGIGARRRKVEDALRALDAPIFIVIDDIDRLDAKEVRDVFKLVRLTASFPNVVYIVAFDRKRVEYALGGQDIPGRDYLEKILQLAVDLPVISDENLRAHIAQAVTAVLDDIDNPGPFDSERWPDVFIEVIRPLVRTMRDVRRYAAGVHGTVRSLGGKISLVDVLGLEAVRIFLPEVFSLLAKSAEALTATRELGYGPRDESGAKAQIDVLLNAARDQREVVHAVIERLFPAGLRHVGGYAYGPDWLKQWLRGRRVAHIDLLRLFLERAVGERLQAFDAAERAFSVLSDEAGLSRVLQDVHPERLEDVISALEAYEDDYPVEAIIPAVTVLLNLWPALPDRDRDVFALDTRMVVGRVVYRLLRRLENDREALARVVREILPRLHTLSARFELITHVGYREGAGHKLIAVEAASELERQLRQEIREAAPDELAAEPELFRLLYHAMKDAGEDEPGFVISDDVALNYAILKSARSEVRSHTVGSRNVRRSYRIHWDVLIDIFGGEEEVRRRVELTRSHYGEDAADLYALIDRYLGGWRPDSFDDDE